MNQARNLFKFIQKNQHPANIEVSPIQLILFNDFGSTLFFENFHIQKQAERNPAL